MDNSPKRTEEQFTEDLNKITSHLRDLFSSETDERFIDIALLNYLTLRALEKSESLADFLARTSKIASDFSDVILSFTSDIIAEKDSTHVTGNQ